MRCTSVQSDIDHPLMPAVDSQPAQSKMEVITKRLIWLYLILLIMEGVLRKWIVPSLSAPLLILRDPIVMAIYLTAFMGRRLVIRGALLWLVVLALLSVVFAILAECDPVVMVYGLRINYLHVPLVFLMADLLTRRDVERLGVIILLLTLPIGLLMVAQYFSPEGSWLNVGAGGEPGQLRGALGRVRPSGPFSFTTGPAAWFPLATAFVMHGWVSRANYPRWLLIAATGMIVLMIPISISRTLMLSVLIVVAFGAVAVLRNPGRLLSILFPLLLVVLLSNFMGGSVTESFASRWDESTSEGFEESIVKRQFSTYFKAIDLVAIAPPFGYGIGAGSNVGARIATGEAGFLLAESEWGKIIMELGPALGWAFILFRCWLALKLFFTGWFSVFRHGDSLPWLLAAATILPVLSGQWAPPTILGFAVFGAGLTLAAANTEDASAPDEDEDTLQPDSEGAAPT